MTSLAPPLNGMPSRLAMANINKAPNTVLESSPLSQLKHEWSKTMKPFTRLLISAIDAFEHLIDRIAIAHQASLNKRRAAKAETARMEAFSLATSSEVDKLKASVGIPLSGEILAPKRLDGDDVIRLLGLRNQNMSQSAPRGYAAAVCSTHGGFLGWFSQSQLPRHMQNEQPHQLDLVPRGAGLMFYNNGNPIGFMAAADIMPVFDHAR